jgi:magnesium transporter
MIVDCAVYEGGRRREGTLSLEGASQACRQDGAFVWLGLFEPTPDELDAVRREFGLHELAAEDALHAHQRPKLEVYDDTLFVVLKPARYVDSEEVVETGEIHLFVSEGFVVAVRHGEASSLKEARKRLEGRSDLVAAGTGGVLYAIVDKVVDDYEPVVEGLEQDIQQIEAQVFSGDRTNPAERIYKMEREVLEFSRAVTPLTPAIDRLARGHFALIDDNLHEYFRDVHDHLLREGQRIDGFRDLLSSALQANLTQVGVRQNEDMRRITAWVAILAVPTAVAGIYGMNFEHMPELRWTYGYPAVLLVTLVICAVLYRRFRRAGWL